MVQIQIKYVLKRIVTLNGGSISEGNVAFLGNNSWKPFFNQSIELLCLYSIIKLKIDIVDSRNCFHKDGDHF